MLNLTKIMSGQCVANRKRPVVIHEQTREMIVRILEVCVEEKKAGKIFLSVDQALERAARYTGLSKKIIINIQRQVKQGIRSRRGRLCNKKNNLNVNCFDRSVVHRCIEDFYLTKKVIPTCSNLLTAVREKIDFPWQATTLRKVLKSMGYQWLKCKGHRRRPILAEKPEIMFARSNYLRKIREYRESDHHVFFLLETLVDKNMCLKKCWKNNLADNVLLDSSTYRLLMVYASAGIFCNGKKLIYKVGTTRSNDCNVNCAEFEKCYTDTLIPNIPPNSVIIIDSVPYQNSQKPEIPSKSSSKVEMVDWLSKHSVEASITMRKDELFKLIELRNLKRYTSKIGEIMKAYEHEVLQLPPYMCDLNPIEVAWAKIKDIVKQHKIHSDLTLEQMRKLMEMSIVKITEKDWTDCDEHVVACEELYWEKDTLMENTLDTFVVEGNNDGDSNSDSESSGSDSDNDYSYY